MVNQKKEASHSYRLASNLKTKYMKTMNVKTVLVALFILLGVSSVQAQSFNDPIFTPSTTVVDFGDVDSKKDRLPILEQLPY